MFSRKRPILLYLISIIAFYSSCQSGQHISVTELIRNAAEYNGQLISVEGCYQHSMEDSYLFPCDKDSDSWDDVISTEYYDSYEWEEEHLGFKSNLIKRKEKPSEAEKILRAMPGISAREEPVKILVEGEFQVSSNPKYGHNRPVKYRFIIHHVLKVENR